MSENENNPGRSEIFGHAERQGIQTKNVMKEDFGFEVPVESVPLPSKGIVYNPESANQSIIITNFFIIFV